MKRKLRLVGYFAIWGLAVLIVSPWPCHVSADMMTSQAKGMYSQYHKAIVQVRVLSQGSGEKSALGSGFFISDEGFFATNYHVISDAALYPSLFSVNYKMYDGTDGKAEIINIDPVHDLAILKADRVSKNFLMLGDSNMNKGTKIFAFGNPYDFGMIVVEGLYNGLMEHAMYRKILFSGSLNPGMSGGAAVKEDGKVFGINVSTVGNDISFFVPVEYLSRLYEEVKDNGGKTFGPKWSRLILKRIVLQDEVFLRSFLEKKNWKKRRIGIAYVPGEISDEFKCWGSTGDNLKNWVKDDYLKCTTGDEIFLSSTMQTGSVSVHYEWYKSRDLNPIRFYNIYESYAANREIFFHNAHERDAGNFVCDQDYIMIGAHRCKIETCARPYKSYRGLYDMSVQLTSADMLNQGLVVNIQMLGFTSMQNKRFLKRFLSEILWED